MSAFDQEMIRRFSDVELYREQMHEYQSGLALPFLLENPFSALFISMGMGKTVITATAIVDLILDGHFGKILVVGPLKVVTDTWPDEFRLWRHTAPFVPTVLREDDDDPRIKAAAKIDRDNGDEREWNRETLEMGGASKRDVREAMPTEEAKVRAKIRAELACNRSTVHLINRENLVWLVNFFGPKWPYRTVIIDESSSFKDWNTERFKALKKVRQTPGLITRLHILTATPAAETYEHLFAQMWLLDLGERLGNNITAYRNNYFVANRWAHNYTLRPGAEQLILDKIKDICLVLDAKDYLDVDEPTIIKRPVHLTPHAREVYDAMQKDMIVTLPDDVVVEADTAAALSSKLLQICSGVLYETYNLLDADTEEMTKVKRVHRIHDEKLTVLRELVEELQGSPVMVAYHFKSSLDRLKKAFPKAVVFSGDGKGIQKQWNDGKIPMLLVHPQSAGHGLNLQKGPGHNLIFFDLVWSLELWQQLIGRLARQGQKNPVFVWVLTALGTVDDRVFNVLSKKQDAQEMLFAILKSMIKDYRRRRKALVQSEASLG